MLLILSFGSDAFAASVASVSAASSNGTYIVGQTVSIHVNFDQNVFVNTGGGTPLLTLETGSSDAQASYVSGSGSSSLVFSFTVQSGHTTSLLDYVSSSSLTLSGGTIKDASNNSATLTLPNPGSANSLAANATIVIDGVVPTVTSFNSSTSNGTYTVGDQISVTVNFSEAVVVTGTPTLVLETGASDAMVNYSSGSGSSSLVFLYTVSSGHTSSDLDCQSTSALSGVIEDVNGNSATLTVPIGGSSGSLASNKALLVDGVAPTVSSVSSSTANGSYKAGQTISIQVNFSESVTVSGTPLLTLETGSVDTSASYVSGSGTSTLNFSYVVEAGDTSADLNVQSSTALSPNGGSISDSIGNVATLTLPIAGTSSLAGSKAIVIDNTAPTVTGITSSTSNGSYRAGQTISIQVNFLEPVTVASGTPQLTLETGASDAVVNYASGSGTTSLTFTYTVVAGHTSADLDYISTTALALNSATMRDAAGNDATLILAAPGAANSLAANKALVVDTTSPSSSLSSGIIGTTSSYPITVTVSFPESVTGLATSDFTVVNGCAHNLVGSGSSYTVDLTPRINGTVSVTLPAGSVTDTAGNSNTASSTLSVDFQTLAPMVTTVTSSPLNGSYTVGSTISVTVNFSASVNVSGTPRLTLETGASDAAVNYSSGSGTSSLTFDYTVSAGHTSADLDYVTLPPLSLNGGTIKDSATGIYDAAFLFACPGATGSLAANSAVVIDTTSPSVASVTSSTANGSYKAGSSINVTVNFSEAVYVTGTPQITLETGTSDAVVNYTSGSGTTALVFTYTVAAGHTTGDLDYISTSALSLNGGTIKDLAGNNSGLTLATPGAANSLGAAKAIVIDTTAPTVTNVTSSTANGSYTTGSVIAIQVVFSEAVTLAGTGAVTLAIDTGTTTNVAYSSGSGTTTLTFNYTVAAGNTSSDLAYTSSTALSLGGSRTLRDVAGNDATLTLPTPGASGSLNTNKDLVVDTTPPTVIDVTSSTSDGRYKVGVATIPISVTFSESVTVTGFPRLLLGVGQNTYATYSSGSGSATLIFNYSIVSGDNSSDLDYASTTALGLNGGTIRDTATNSATLTLPALGASGSLSYNKAIIIDTQVPTVASIVAVSANGAYRAGQQITLRVNFSEAVNVSGTPTLTLETGSTDGVASYSSGSGTSQLNFVYTVSAGENSADLEVQSNSALSGSVSDLAGNSAVLTLTVPGVSSSADIVIDTVSPTVTISSSVASGGATNLSSVQITATFSESVSGFDLGDLVVTNGTASNLASVSGTQYTFDIAPSSNGSVSVYIASNAASDAAGNGSTQSATSLFTYDTIAPTITDITSTTANGSYRVGAAAIPVSVTFSESVTVTGTPRILMGVGQDTYATYTSGSGSNTLIFSYTILSGDNSSDLDYLDDAALGLNGGAINDAALNSAILSLPQVGSTGSLSANKALVIDTLSPTATGVVAVTSDGAYRAGQQITLSVDFSESVSVTGTPTLNIETGSADGVASYTGGSGSPQLTFVYTVSAGDSTSDLEVQSATALSGVITDIAGNTAVLTLTVPYLSLNSEIVIDTEAPSVAVTSTVPPGGLTNSSEIRFAATFSEDVSGFANTSLSIVNGIVTEVTQINGSQYEFYVSPGANGPVSVQVSHAGAVDLAGNGNIESTVYEVIYDGTAPNIPQITAPGNNSIFNVASIVVSGTADPATSVELSDQHTVLCTTNSDDNGYWSCSLSGLSEGRHNVKARSTDASSNSSGYSSIVRVVIDAVALVSPLVDSSISRLGADRTPLFLGSAEPNIHVVVRKGSELLCVAQSSGTGAWSCESSILSSGPHQLTAQALDPRDDTVSPLTNFAIEIGVVIQGIVVARNMSRTPLADVVVSFGTESVTTNSSGEFEIVVPDQPGVVLVARKPGWTISLDASRQWQPGETYIYLAGFALESSSYAIWDSFAPALNHQLKLFNKSTAPGALGYTIFNSAGDICDSGESEVLGNQDDATLNMTGNPCLAAIGSYGTARINYDREYDGEYSSWLPGAGDRDLRTIALDELVNPIRGTSYAIFDTGAPAINQTRDPLFSESVLLISNVSDQYSTYRIVYRQENGSTALSRTLSLAPRATERIVLGSPTQKRPVAGVVEISPDDLEAPYVAVVRRYGYKILKDKKGTISKSGVLLVNSEVARSGLRDPQITKFDYSNTLDRLNYLEFGNTSNRGVEVTLVHTGQEIAPRKRGSKSPQKTIVKRTTIKLNLNPRSYQRIPFSRFIKTSTEGTLAFSVSEPGAVLVNVVANTYSKQSLASSKVYSLKDLFGSDQYAFFSANPPTSINVANLNRSTSRVSVECLINGTTVDASMFTLASQQVASYLPGPACVAGAAGLIHVTSDSLSGIIAERSLSRSRRGVRLRSRGR